MVRAALGAIAGFFGIGVLVVFTDQILSVMSYGFNSTAAPTRSYYVIRVVTDSFYSFLGGYICAGIAKQSVRLATVILLVGGELIGIAAMIPLWRTVPHWFAIGLLVLFPACAGAGSQFYRRREGPVSL
jgi:hypothetical protein